MENAEIVDVAMYKKLLQKRKIGYFDIPKEHRNNKEIINVERKLGIRVLAERGFDIIRDCFFVVEDIFYKINSQEKMNKAKTTFSNFTDYYEFLNGDIYKDACYFQYLFTNDEIETYNIDLKKINTVGYVDFTVSTVIAEQSEKEEEKRKKEENEKALRVKWIEQLDKCETYDQFIKTIESIKEQQDINQDVQFYLYNYIFLNKNRAFSIIMQYLSEENGTWHLLMAMCAIYNPSDVLNAYNYGGGDKRKSYRHKKMLKDAIEQMRKEDIIWKNYGRFDAPTQFYCCEVRGYRNIESENIVVKYPIYFQTFDELASFLDNDLPNCEVSNAKLFNTDFSIYKTNKKTLLPSTCDHSDIKCKVDKWYNRRTDQYCAQCFWIDKNGNIVTHSDQYRFDYFFNFVRFLENDLSNADLLFCDGFANLHDFSVLNLKGAKLRSGVLDRLGMPYSIAPIKESVLKSFDFTETNENDTSTALEGIREIYDGEVNSRTNQKIYYVTDLHLVHSLKDICKTEIDVFYELQKIIDKLLADIAPLYNRKNILLIGGDTSSNFQIFSQFVIMLRNSIDELHLNIQVVFLLGNHELWGFSGETLNNIAQEYIDLLVEQKMYLLQNNILYSDNNGEVHKITTSDLETRRREDIRKVLKSARIILFGGLAFSGQNEEFNANNGIYEKVISREQEIQESTIFNSLYDKVCDTLPDRNVIVFTHMPQKDWRDIERIQSGFVYVNGHTHRNQFYDDGEYRIYADNQRGYKRTIPHLKYFYIDNTYDVFLDYKDGIHKISREQYTEFYRGKSLRMDFTRNINILYMLKKNGYYCFIHQNNKGNLAILNGGAMKSLSNPDINYYYVHMDRVISRINQPLNEFTSVQRKIASTIKEIGGRGTIHGSIIDIDYFNHIYVNPFDGSITGYWASDIINKKVYLSVSKLLEENCPALYENYIKMIGRESQAKFALFNNVNIDLSDPIYLDTDIYRVSCEIKKMQKLDSKILSTWFEPECLMIE